MKRLKGAGRKPASPSRSNTTSSIRGKISAPIPIATADDEFPIREPGTGIATAVGHDGAERQLWSPPTPLQADTSQHEKAEEADIIAPVEESLRPSPSVLESTVPSQETPIPQARQVSSVRDSGASQPSGSSLEKPQRKKSTLRTVLGRLFGKKRKSDGSTNGIPEESARAGQHRSDPSALRKPSGQTLSPQRSASMPINEFNRALNSHSLFADERKRQTVGTVGDSRDIDRRSRPRGSTTPSRLFDPTRTPGYFDWTGLSPRPASSHARDSEGLVGADVVDTEGLIGYAVTSGSHPNRRSRSTGQLRDAAMQHGVRRRSDEIRYWRESYPSYDPDAMSPISSQHRPEADSRRETRDGGPSPQPETPEVPQPFNFGPLGGEMAGMKITEAASLENRVSTLEARLERMERAVANLHDRVSVSSLPLRDSPSASRSRTDSSDQSLPKHSPNRMYLQTNNPQAETSYKMQNQSYESSRPSTTSTQPSEYQSYEELSPRPTYISSPESAAGAPLLRTHLSARHSESMGRPLSTSTTIRGIASSSPTPSPDPLALSKSGSLTAHHYSALLNLITAEQTARQTLEAQVASLQQQLQSLLSRRLGETHRGSVIYHHQRPEQLPSRKTMGAAPVEFSSFEHEHETEEEESGTESEGETMSFGSRREHVCERQEREEEEDEEVYQTPPPGEEGRGYADARPRRHHNDDDNEAELVEMETKTRGEPRTLSLSQLTMGKGALTGVEF